eukprot:TRINITY_DN134_c0_g1_i1.p1 TRINITY_DN134_c0_g1~~TRINITY_DN134_c0_g1_i1.p1  ORF type:complete len:112 (-),score=12.21 TRINITY_DN134_c0_g1_i1:26-361(-)
MLLLDNIKTNYIRVNYLLVLGTEGASWGKTGLTTSWLGEDGAARGTNNDGGRVAEDGSDLEARRTLNVKEAGLWSLNQSLTLVGVLLVLQGRVQDVSVEETHFVVISSSEQ